MKQILLAVFAIALMQLPTGAIHAADWTIDVVVAQDGSGDFLTITEAIDSATNDGTDFVIFIKNGTYNEKLFIVKNNITLLGEDRENTIITQAILRRVFNEENGGSDWGCATINIENSVTDFTLANLTVRNNFADLNPDFPNKNDHTMAIRGGGNRIIIVNCKITATGGDTLSLWNTAGGMFYHSGCYFEGWVDYVCPRGYCYISNSEFYGYNTNASIWHDGSGAKDHKLVVRNSYFDGVTNFGLGRFHRMSAFYLLDCNFSERIRDNGGINYVGDSSAQDRDKLVYGVRVYYDKCDRNTGNYAWHSNNLKNAEYSPEAGDINDSWTFNNSWNPEIQIAGLLSCAFLPKPGLYAKKVGIAPVLSWLAGKNAAKHLVYFGTDSIPPFVGSVNDTFYTPGTLSGTTQYFWRVDEVNGDNDTIQGSLWNFYTTINKAPDAAFNPKPENGSDYFSYTTAFEWEANPLEVDTFYFWFGSEQNLEMISAQTNVGYRILGLPKDSVYYWRVDSKNEIGTTQGPLWHFRYKPELVSNHTEENNAYWFNICPQPVNDKLIINLYLAKHAVVEPILYDLSGKVVHYFDKYEQTAGNNYILLSLNETRIAEIPGHYIIVLKIDETIVSQCIIKI